MAKFKESVNNMALGILAYQNARRNNDLKAMQDQLNKIKIDSAQIKLEGDQLNLKHAKAAMDRQEALRKVLQDISSNDYYQASATTQQEGITDRQIGLEPADSTPAISQISAGLQARTPAQPIPPSTQRKVQAASQQVAATSPSPAEAQAPATTQSIPAAEPEVEPAVGATAIGRWLHHRPVIEEAPPSEPEVAQPQAGPPVEAGAEQALALASAEPEVAPVASESVVEEEVESSGPTTTAAAPAISRFAPTEEDYAFSGDVRRKLAGAGLVGSSATQEMALIPGTVEWKQSQALMEAENFVMQKDDAGNIVRIDKRTGYGQQVFVDRRVTPKEAALYGVGAGTMVSQLGSLIPFDKDLVQMVNDIPHYVQVVNGVPKLIAMTNTPAVNEEDVTAVYNAYRDVKKSIASNKELNQLREGYNRYRSAIDVYNSNSVGTKDYALIKLFEKVLDPTSVIRQSEFDTLSEFIPGLMKAFGVHREGGEGVLSLFHPKSVDEFFFGPNGTDGYISKFTRGAELTDPQRQSLLKVMQALAQGNVARYNEALDREYADVEAYRVGLGAKFSLPKETLGYLLDAEPFAIVDKADGVIERFKPLAREPGFQKYVPVQNYDVESLDQRLEALEANNGS